MPYVLPADFRTETVKPWTHGLTLDETVTDTYLTDVITQIQERIENDLSDTFEPPSPDNDVTVDVDAWGGRRLYFPFRVRSITTLSTRDAFGVLTAQAATLWRLVSSVSGADLSGHEYDYAEVIRGQYLAGTNLWPIGAATVQFVGKKGWASTPTDIKRATALLVYDHIKPMDGRLRKTEQLRTEQGTYIFTPPDDGETGIREADAILRRYRRPAVLVR